MTTDPQSPPSCVLPRLLRLKQVCELTGLCRSMIYQLESEGGFPRRLKLATRAVGWVEGEIHVWITERVVARDSPSPRTQPSPLTLARTLTDPTTLNR
jgi:prophage regulatory protein